MLECHVLALDIDMYEYVKESPLKLPVRENFEPGPLSSPNECLVGAPRRHCDVPSDNDHEADPLQSSSHWMAGRDFHRAEGPRELERI